MIARIIIAIAAVAGVVMTVSAGDREAPANPAIPTLQATGPLLSPLTMPAPVVVQSSTCAAECQTHHDRCRVRTKGSSVCDGERQACLEKCLQRKSR